MPAKGGEKIKNLPKNRAKPGKAAKSNRKEQGAITGAEQGNNRKKTEKIQSTAARTFRDHHAK